MISEKKDTSNWTFLTNHAHVLLCLAGNNAMTMREIASEVGITERAVQQIITDLVDTGYIDRIREGRSNRYMIHENLHLRHPIEKNCLIKSLIDLINGNCGQPGEKVYRQSEKGDGARFESQGKGSLYLQA